MSAGSLDQKSKYRPRSSSIKSTLSETVDAGKLAPGLAIGRRSSKANRQKVY